jgi:hypothetical protein
VDRGQDVVGVDEDLIFAVVRRNAESRETDGVAVGVDCNALRPWNEVGAVGNLLPQEVQRDRVDVRAVTGDLSDGGGAAVVGDREQGVAGERTGT